MQKFANKLYERRFLVMETAKGNTDEKIKKLWEDKSRRYNSIFNYLENKGLKEKELIEFSRLLLAYIELV
jgi:hypothetical protein